MEKRHVAAQSMVAAGLMTLLKLGGRFVVRLVGRAI